MLVAGLVFREHLGRHLLTGTAFVVAAGVVLVASADADLRWGGLVIAAACLCWAFDNSITASLDHLQPSAITLAKGAVAGSANLALGLALDGGWPAAGPVCAALAIGALGYGVSITLWVTGARDLGAARAQLVFATAPFVGAIAAWAIGDSITARELVAFALGAVGVAFVLRSGHDHTHHHHAMSHGHEHVHDDGHHDHFHDEAIAPGTRHTHEHEHAPRVHSHPHVPDLHHRHDH
jgi:drug/metabolite transporter (DMT)-like permease